MTSRALWIALTVAFVATALLWTRLAARPPDRNPALGADRVVVGEDKRSVCEGAPSIVTASGRSGFALQDRCEDGTHSESDLKAEPGASKAWDKTLSETWVDQVMALQYALQGSALSPATQDALKNPQLPQYPVESWITEVLSVARTSTDPRIRWAALRVLGWNVVHRRDSCSTSTYLRLFDDLANDSSLMVRREALRGLVVLWNFGRIDAAKQSIVQIAESHSDDLLRDLASRSLRDQPWPPFGGSVQVEHQGPGPDWQTAQEYTK